jgi:hypothetical protein
MPHGVRVSSCEKKEIGERRCSCLVALPASFILRNLLLPWIACSYALSSSAQRWPAIMIELRYLVVSARCRLLELAEAKEKHGRG